MSEDPSAPDDRNAFVRFIKHDKKVGRKIEHLADVPELKPNSPIGKFITRDNKLGGKLDLMANEEKAEEAREQMLFDAARLGMSAVTFALDCMYDANYSQPPAEYLRLRLLREATKGELELFAKLAQKFEGELSDPEFLKKYFEGLGVEKNIIETEDTRFKVGGGSYTTNPDLQARHTLVRVIKKQQFLRQSVRKGNINEDFPENDDNDLNASRNLQVTYAQQDPTGLQYLSDIVLEKDRDVFDSLSDNQIMRTGDKQDQVEYKSVGEVDALEYPTLSLYVSLYSEAVGQFVDLGSKD